MELKPGTVVADRFRLVRKLGEGGMGSVWLAHHEKLETNCAVKFINADVASAAGVKERFEREAKIAAQIKSPHVVHVLDYGVCEGVPYIAMEYLEGEDLSHRLDARGRLSPDETLAVVAQIARALTKAHAAGLVHRDLKPENVYLVRDDDQELVKVLDFGIAKAQNPMPDGNTRTGMMMGTPRFMSPEQAQGLKTLDYRSDLWSLGVIAYRCVVGALPFDSEAMGDLMMRIIVHPLPVPSQVLPGLPASFDAWWTRAAARDPAQRFQSAKELSEALGAALGLAPAISGPAAIASGRSGSTPSIPSSMTPRAITPAQGAPLTPTMAGAATMLPAGRTGAPSYASGATPAPLSLSPGSTPEHTMSPASRTFAGAEPPPKKTPVVLFALLGVIGLVAIAAIAGFSALAMRNKAKEADSASSAPPASASVATPDPKPSVEPAQVAADVPSAAPSASAAAVPQAAKPVGRPRPTAPTPPPPPARTGKVKIVAP